MTVMTDREHNDYIEEHERVLEFDRLRIHLEKRTDDYIAIAAFLMDVVWSPEQGVFSYDQDEEVIWAWTYEITKVDDRWVFEDLSKNPKGERYWYYTDCLEGLKTTRVLISQGKA